jgi:hypothetical protein
MGRHHGWSRLPRRQPHAQETHGYGAQAMQGGPPARPSRTAWLLAGLGALVWSLLAWLGYGLADGILRWLASSVGTVVEGGRGLAGAAGVGREVGAAIDAVQLSGVLGWLISLLAVVLKPAIVLVWGLGVAALLAAPVLLPRLAGRFGRHGGWNRH